MNTSNDKLVACARTSQEREDFLTTLPQLSGVDVPCGEICPICLVPFSILLEDERADKANVNNEQFGITRLPCGHIFCMSDIVVWINTSHGSCPTCRTLFLIIPEPSDDESSDGGEYIPGSDSVADDMMDGETWSDDEEVWSENELEVLSEDNSDYNYWDFERSWELDSNPGPGAVYDPDIY